MLRLRLCGLHAPKTATVDQKPTTAKKSKKVSARQLIEENNILLLENNVLSRENNILLGLLLIRRALRWRNY